MIAAAGMMAPEHARAQVTSYVLAASEDQVRLIDAASGTLVNPPIANVRVRWGELVVTPDGRRAVLTATGQVAAFDFLNVATRMPIAGVEVGVDQYLTRASTYLTDQKRLDVAEPTA